VRASGDFSGDHGQAGGHQRLARDTALRILPHYFIENGVGYLISNLVGMAFGDGLRSKQKIP
jgi:hypothetical protein